MPHIGRPSFNALGPAACREILERNHIGRIAFSFHDRVDIEPIHYVCADGWIYGRTTPGAKLVTLQHHPWVAFEVDEVEGMFSWQSVVVHGAVYFLEPSINGTQDDQADAAYETAVAHLRRIIPAALHHDDPTPERTIVFRIHTSEISGRQAIPARSDVAL